MFENPKNLMNDQNPKPLVSEREMIQLQIEEFLVNNSEKFTAPYGILTGMEELPKGGKVRTITFGVARSLDATIYIFSPKNITVRTQGGLGYKIEGNYKSVNELMDKLKLLV